MWTNGYQHAPGSPDQPHEDIQGWFKECTEKYYGENGGGCWRHLSKWADYEGWCTTCYKAGRTPNCEEACKNRGPSCLEQCKNTRPLDSPTNPDGKDPVPTTPSGKPGGTGGGPNGKKPLVLGTKKTLPLIPERLRPYISNRLLRYIASAGFEIDYNDIYVFIHSSKKNYGANRNVIYVNKSMIFIDTSKEMKIKYRGDEWKQKLEIGSAAYEATMFHELLHAYSFQKYGFIYTLIANDEPKSQSVYYIATQLYLVCMTNDSCRRYYDHE